MNNDQIDEGVAADREAIREYLMRKGRRRKRQTKTNDQESSNTNELNTRLEQPQPVEFRKAN